MQITNIEKNVDLIELDQKKIYLVGTAHISKSSVELAEKVIRQFNPQVVAVELCQPRYESLKDPNRWKNTNIATVIRQGKTYLLMAQLILAGFQKKLGDQLHVKPGAEMLRSTEVAEELGMKLALVDREVKITLKRVWGALSLWGMGKLLFSMLSNLFDTKQISEEELEKLKSGDALEDIMKEFSVNFPTIRETLISERDMYLAQKIKTSCADTIVAIVGAGHVPGIKTWISKDVDLAALETTPPPNAWSKIMTWFLPLAIIGMIVYGFFASGGNTSYEMMKAWFWINGFAAAVGAAIALSHPLTVLSAFFAAPFTALHPFLASGWVAGLVEAMIRKPLVSDLERIADDVGSLKGLWRNRLSRILLVVAFTNLFGTIGAIVGGSVVASML